VLRQVDPQLHRSCIFIKMKRVACLQSRRKRNREKICSNICHEKGDDDEGCDNKEDSIAIMNRQQLCHVDLLITSSFLPAAAMPILVHRLPRLSVPVPKSFLQKVYP